MDINKAIEKYFHNKGRELVGKLKDQLKKKKKVATGKTINSIDYTISAVRDAQMLSIVASEDIAYIIGGRKKGQLPPIEEIEAWTKSKGLNKNAAWAIAEDLKENAIKGLSLNSFVKREDQKIFEDLQELIVDVQETNILNELTDELKKSGLTVQ